MRNMTEISGPGAHELLIERTVDAPPARVWRMWSEPERMRGWWGPKGFACTHLEMDFRPGGVWRACIVSDEYGELWMGGQYRKIRPVQLLIFTFSWDQAQDGEGVNTVVEMTLRETLNGGTLMLFRQAPFRAVEGRDSHAAGWTESLDRLREHVETGSEDGAA